MTPISKLALRGILMAAAVIWAAADGSQPASAQGSIACRYGPSDYKRCCDESYRENPNLGARARARDIDACRKGGNSENDRDDPPASRNSSDRDDRPASRDDRDDRPAPRYFNNRNNRPASRDDRDDRPASKNSNDDWPPKSQRVQRSRTDSQSAGSGIRRVDCGSSGCESGCDADEMAISAFCPANTAPTSNGDRSIRCSKGGAYEWPSVIFCARK